MHLQGELFSTINLYQRGTGDILTYRNYSNQENDDSVDRLKDNRTKSITETAAGVGEATCRKHTSIATHKAKELIAKRKNIKLYSMAEQTPKSEL